MGKWMLALGLSLLLSAGTVEAEKVGQRGDEGPAENLADEQSITKAPIPVQGRESKATRQNGQDEKNKALPWANRVKFQGDFRYRYDAIDEENNDTRNRHRMRARIGLDAEVAESVKLGFRIATGSDNPVSTMQSFDGGFSTKEIWLDLAYFDWHPARLTGLQIIGGKIINPFYQAGGSELLWDDDLRPEGLVILCSRPFGQLEIMGHFGGFWVEERSKDHDSSLWGAQGGLKYKLPGYGAYFLGGIGYFNFTNTIGMPPFYDETNSWGNTVDEFGNYAGDFDEVEAFSEFGFQAYHVPIEVFLDYVNNIAVDQDNQGWCAGFTFGKCRSAGSWAFRYNYRELEKDAVIGIFTDSNFIGGGTDGRGHEIGFDYRITKNVKAGVKYFKNTMGFDEETGYQRFMIETDFFF